MKKIHFAIVVLIIIVIFLIIVLKKDSKSEEIKKDVIYNTLIVTDEVTGEYVVYNEFGEEIARSLDEVSLEIYKSVPDYDPKTPVEEFE